MKELPLVSVAVVAYNAAAFLGTLLRQIQAQSYPHERIELLLINSASEDGTRAVMEAFAGEADFQVKVLENPDRTLPAGCNVALRAYRGELIIRLDAHSAIAPDFLEINVREIEKGHDIVGGYVLAVAPDTDWATVLAAVDSSRFCGGVARFRNKGKTREVDTLAYAMYRRRVYDTVGLYDERLSRTEDNEMAYRIKRAGFAFYYTPDICSWRHTRRTLRDMLAQKWDNGKWIARTLFIQPKCFRPRHFVPVAFVVALALCILLAIFHHPLPLALLLAVYLACDLGFAVEAAIRQERARALTLLTLPVLFPLVHLSYGIGTIAGLRGAWKLRRMPRQSGAENQDGGSKRDGA